MKARIINCRKLKLFIRSVCLVLITIYAFMIFGASILELMESNVEAFAWFIVSLGWLVLFCIANCRNKKSAEVQITIMHSTK